MTSIYENDTKENADRESSDRQRSAAGRALQAQLLSDYATAGDVVNESTLISNILFLLAYYGSIRIFDKISNLRSPFMVKIVVLG